MKKVLWVSFVGGVLVWLFLLGAYLWRFGSLGISDNQGVWGEFGDYLGGFLNPVFGFASFLILVYALHLERQVNTEQRETADVQNFERTFFQLLHRFNGVVDDVRYEYIELTGSLTSLSMFTYPAEKKSLYEKFECQGRNAIRAMYQYGFKGALKKVAPAAGVSQRERYCKANEIFFREVEHELGIYFRTLYHVFKFIDQAPLSFADKARYANVARAQLSSYELSMIFYNGLWGEGARGMKPLIEKYGLLKHIKERHVIASNDLAFGSLYPEAAFSKFTRRWALFGEVEPIIEYD